MKWLRRVKNGKWVPLEKAVREKEREREMDIVFY